MPDGITKKGNKVIELVIPFTIVEEGLFIASQEIIALSGRNPDEEIYFWLLQPLFQISRRQPINKPISLIRPSSNCLPHIFFYFFENAFGIFYQAPAFAECQPNMFLYFFPKRSGF